METTGLALFVFTIIFLIGYRLVRSGIPKLPHFDIPENYKEIHFFYLKGSMSVVVSLSILASSLHIILSGNYDSGTQNWAFGSAGAIIGFWLRPEK